MCQGDDYWTDPLKLQKQVEFLDNHLDYSMCFTNAIEHWESGIKEDKLFFNIENREYDGVEYTRDELMKHGFKSPLGPVHMPDSVKNYLESIKDSGHKKGKFDSWTIVDEQTARKLTDRSFFEHHGSGIPAEIRWFFDAEDMQNGTKKTISLIYEGKQYDAHFDK